MTQPGITQNHGGERLQGKGLYAGPVLQGGDWALVLPAPKLAATSLLSFENFVEIGPSVQKLLMIFQNMDAQTYTNESPLYHSVQAKKLCPVFSTSHKME